LDALNPERHVYSRYSADAVIRAEQVLSKITNGFALLYSSGLASAFAALTYYQPKRIAITDGYHGSHMTIETYKKTRPDLVLVNLDDEYQDGDLCWLETPRNPDGIALDIKHYAEKIHAVGGKLVVDATFGPPPLQDPFKWGADLVMHSGTKYFGGHSDLLMGVLVARSREEWEKLWKDRTFLGTMPGSLEAWLLLRSLRTLHLRIPRQSQNATAIVQWLSKLAETPTGQEFDGAPGGVVETVSHASLQGKDSKGWEPSIQMEGGWNATFSMKFYESAKAFKFPYLLNYFVPATSLGGVESLIEQRYQSDSRQDPKLLRLSIGVEEGEDLISDLRQAFQAVVKVE